MSKAFIASVIQDSVDCTGVAANQAAADLIAAIVREMKKEGGFTLPSFGTFTVRKTKARKALNPRTGEGEGRQDGALQGEPEPEEGGLIRPSRVLVPIGAGTIPAWLGREDSNLRMAESKSAALPLGDAPPTGS